MPARQTVLFLNFVYVGQVDFDFRLLVEKLRNNEASTYQHGRTMCNEETFEGFIVGEWNEIG